MPDPGAHRHEHSLAVSPGARLIGREHARYAAAEPPGVSAVRAPRGQPPFELVLAFQHRPAHQPLSDLPGGVDDESLVPGTPDPMHPAFGLRAVRNACRAELGACRERRDSVSSFVPRGPDRGPPRRAVRRVTAALVALPDPSLMHERLIVVPG